MLQHLIKKMKKYSFNYFSSSYKIFMVFIALGSLAILVSYNITQDVRALYLLGAILLMFSYIIYQSFFSNSISLGKKGATFVSDSKKIFISWKKVKKFGIFMQSSGTEGVPIQSIESKELKEDYFRGAKYIYLSKSDHPTLTNTNQDGFICFEYRQEAYQWIYRQLLNIG